MQIDFGLTSLSQKEIDSIYYKNLSPKEVYDYLTNEIKLRTFADILKQFYPGDDLKENLISGLCELEDISQANISRKVRNWLNGESMPSDRDELIKICFILSLDELSANSLLSLTSESIFHYRNPRELVFAYCLRVGKSYNEALNMIEDINSLKPDKNDSTREDMILTKNVTEAFQNVDNDKAFNEFYIKNYDYFGELHNTAYTIFTRLLDLLIRPEFDYSEDEEKYSVETVVNKYLRMNLPLDKRTSKYTVLQRTVRRFWPNTTSIIKMRNREEDVSRRILLLLYLVTEGGITDEDGGVYILDEDFTDTERFEEHYWRLNSMLNDCGMGRLDSRNRFEWLILYCLKSSDDEAMSERMQEVLDIIFSTETS